MASNPTPKLRLLIKGKEKLDSLLHRRKKNKKDTDESIESHGDESDFEDEGPILSRIEDPAKFAAYGMRMDEAQPSSSSSTSITSHYENSQYSQANNEFTGTEQDGDQNEVDQETDIVGEERSKKTLRRRGITGIEELTIPSQKPMVFKTNTIMCRKRVVALQPLAPFPSNLFTFNAQNAVPMFCPFRGLGVRKMTSQSTTLRVEQAACSAFLQSKPESEELPEELYDFPKSGITVEHITNTRKTTPTKAKVKTSRRKSSPKTSDAPPFEFLQKPMQMPTKDDPLSYLRLSAASTSRKPTIDKAQSNFTVPNFVRPKIQAPLPTAELFRNSQHTPLVPKDVFLNSAPTDKEVIDFVQDIKNHDRTPRLTKEGDVPTITPTTIEDRVPVKIQVKPMRVTRDLQTGATSLPLHAANERSKLPTVPETYYTEPGRLTSALEFARSQRSVSQSRGVKRKRGDATLPPPSHIYQHTNDPDFNIFTNGILCYPELTLTVASYLPVDTLVNLYSISKDFHIIVNQRFTTVILNQLTVKAPCATKCYPWSCYAHLCQVDPSLFAQNTPLGHTGEVINIRTLGPLSNSNATPYKPKPNVLNDSPSNITISIPPVKKVPTFRYLRMAIHREKVIHEIYSIFAEHGVPLPGCPATYYPKPHEHRILQQHKAFATTLHKLWFLFDIPDNGRRQGYIRSSALFTNHDLLYGLTFLVKLDMILQDPLAAEKRDGMRKLLFSARDGFDTFLRVLKRDTSTSSRSAGPGGSLTNELDLLRSWVRYNCYIDEVDGTEHTVVTNNHGTVFGGIGGTIPSGIAGGGRGVFLPFNLTPDQRAASPSLFGIPRDEIGLLQREFWGGMDLYQRNQPGKSKGQRRKVVVGRQPELLMRPDQILIRETVRRGLVMNKQFLRAMLHGYVDQETLERIPRREYGRRSEVLEGMGEYEIEELAGGLGALKVDEGGDELLDLGRKQSEIGSELVVVRTGVGKREMEKRRGEKVFRERMYDAWKEDVKKEKKLENKKRMRKLMTGEELLW